MTILEGRRSSNHSYSRAATVYLYYKCRYLLKSIVYPNIFQDLGGRAYGRDPVKHAQVNRVLNPLLQKTAPASFSTSSGHT